MFKYIISAFSSRSDHPALAFLLTMCVFWFVTGIALEFLSENGFLSVSEFTPGFFGVFGVFAGFLALFGYAAVFTAKYVSVLGDRFAEEAR